MKKRIEINKVPRNTKENKGSVAKNQEALDENCKTNPLQAKFVGSDEADSDNDVQTVSLLSMFRFSTIGERILLLIGVISAIITGCVQPLMLILFGDLTGVLIDGFGENGTEAPGMTDDEIKQLEDAFMEGINKFAVRNAILGAVMLVFTYISIVTFNYTAAKQIFRIRDLYFKSALQQDVGWYDKQQTGDFASRMSEDVIKLEEGLGEKVSMFIYFQVSFLACLIVALVKGWKLALVCLVCFPVSMVSMALVGVVSGRLAKKELDAYGKAGSIAEEVLSSMRTVIAFGGQNKEVERYSKNLVYAKDINIKRGFFNGIGQGTLWFFIYASYALAFWYGVGLVLEEKYEENPEYTAPTMVTVFFGVMMASMTFGMSAPLIESFGIAKGAAAKIFSVIDRKSPIDSLSEEGLRPTTVAGTITFKGVCFHYPTRQDVKVLRGLNLTIDHGQTVALVGSSGCGKSTCIQLIQRFYDPIEGAVYLDGNDIRELNIGWLRSHLGVVGQEPVLFQTTIAENIRYGRDSATMDEIIAAAKEANAHDFISKLPQGYDTLVGERGAQISGGQKQRIAIARALVRKPVILLLDEATSALDTNSEAKVQAALDRASRGRTTIIVAHRLSTIRNADKIVVLNNGVVVEEGTHEELMALSGHYHGLVTSQISHADDDNESVLSGGKEEKQKLSRMLSVHSDVSSAVGDADEVVPSAVVTETEDKPPSVRMWNVVQYNKPEWPLIGIGTFCSVIMGCAMPVFAVLFGEIMQILGDKDEDYVRRETNRFCLYFVAAGVLTGFATFFQIYLFGIAGEKLTMRMRSLAFEAMLRQEIGWFDDKSNNTGALCSRLSGDAAAVQGATGQRIGTVIQSLATLILGVTLSMYYEARLGAVALAFAPLLLIGNYFAEVAASGEILGTTAAMEKSTKLAVEAVGNIRTVLGLGRERLFHAQYMLELLPAHKRALRNTHIRATVYSAARSVMYFAYSVCIWYGGILVRDDGLPYGSVLKVSEALIMGTMSIANALAFAPNFQKGLTAAGKIFHLLARKPKVYDMVDFTDPDWVAEGNVQYSSIEFSYPTRPSVQVLKGLDLSIFKGQTVALVGPSGCGKSTLIQLLERFYDPDSGVVFLDNRDISAVRMASLRAQLGIVSQEPVLFDRTIAENIAYGDNYREVTMPEIIDAAKKANIHTFISSLPSGYDTRMGEKGTQLSGGQKQRVAIARALVRNPRVLLLDEATSALDTESEKVVQEALDKAKEGRTCITIAHRLSTIQDADVICVVNNGVVAEQGRHKELLAQRGIYHKLHNLQSGQR